MLRDYVAVDLEMTGLKSSRDKILEIGAVRVRQGKQEAFFQTLVYPGCQIPREIVELTGITQKMAEGGKPLEQALREFLDFDQGLPLVGHNISFDYRFLKQNMINCRLDFETPVLDTLSLARKFLKGQEKKTLDALCAHFQIRREQNHRALEDAKATGALLEILWDSYGEECPEVFAPRLLTVKVKRQGPATLRQKKYLKDLANYHKIELPADLDSLTKSEASRLTDQILACYGRMD